MWLKIILMFVALYSSYMVIKGLIKTIMTKLALIGSEANAYVVYVVIACICWALLYGLKF